MFDINIDPAALRMDGLSSIVESYPPTRENWEAILRFWQWSFPIVSLPMLNISQALTLTTPVWLLSMDHQVVRHGQNLDQIRSQPPRPLCLDEHGMPRLPHPHLCHVHPAAP